MAADIGLRALMVLAGRPERLRTVAGLAVELSVSERHLGKVVQRLAAGGLLDTTRGRGGGLRISAQGLGASAAEVLTLIEGGPLVIDCDNPPCPLASLDCRLRRVLGGAQEAFMGQLRAITIAEMATTTTAPAS